MRHTLAALLVALALPSGAAQAYVRSAGGTTEPAFLRWSSNTQTYQINALTSGALPNVADDSDPLTAVARGFQAWEDVLPSAINLNFGGLTAAATAGSPGNIVSFVDNTFAFNGALAVTIVSSSAGQILDADMVFNPAVQWGTRNLTSTQYDVQAVATHEAGHFVGLAHSGLHSATMYPYAKAQVQIDRFLEPDDVAGVSEAYPEERLGLEYGKINGVVTRGGVAVFGAHVVAVDGAGRPVVGALTIRNGTFEMYGVPPGSYQVYVEPVDGPFEQGNLLGFWTSAAFDKAFHGTLLAGWVDVVEGMSTSVGTIAVNNAVPTHNPRVFARQPATGGGFTADGVLTTVNQGDVNRWYIVVGGDACGSPATFSISGPGITPIGSFSYGTFNGGTPYVRRRFDFAPNAKATPRVVVVTRGAQSAFMSGPLEILPNPPRLHVDRDRLLNGSIYATWYGGVPPYELGRDTMREFSAPVTLYSATDLGFSDVVLNDGEDYYYQILP